MAEQSNKDAGNPPAAARELEFLTIKSDGEDDVDKDRVGMLFTKQTTEEDIDRCRFENRYIDKQISSSDLVLINPGACAQAFKEEGPLGLFFPFIP